MGTQPSIKFVLPIFFLALGVCGGDDGSPGASGSPGAPALIATEAEPAGLNCPSGGWRIESGSDRNWSGILDDSEVSGVSYICNGHDGSAGSDGAEGLTALLSVVEELEGVNCPVGGQRI